jgi:hypothetical protein
VLASTLYNELQFEKLSFSLEELRAKAKNLVEDTTKNVLKSDADRSILNRLGLYHGGYTIPGAVSEVMPGVDGRALLKSFGYDRFAEGPLSYLSPQNINRAALVGGTLAGGLAGGNTPGSYAYGLGGSLGGSLVGGYASLGLNKAIDAYKGINTPTTDSALRRAISDVVLPGAGALTGGYYAGKYL